MIFYLVVFRRSLSFSKKTFRLEKTFVTLPNNKKHIKIIKSIWVNPIFIKNYLDLSILLSLLANQFLHSV